MKSILKALVISVLLCLAADSIAQDDLLSATIDSALLLRDNSKFEEASAVLDDFNNKYPGNIAVMRLYAETLFWMKDYNEAAQVYEESIRMNPDNLDVKYEYAILLFDRGRYERAKEQLDVYTDNNPGVAGAESLLGITNYYLGNFKEADEHLEKSLLINPSDKRTREIYRQVLRIVKPWLSAVVTFTDDSQPLKRWAPALQAGWYRSHLLNLTFLLDFQNYSSESIQTNRINFQLQNSFQFPKAGFSAKISAGTFYASVDQSIDFTWGISLGQKIVKYLNVRAGAERSPYTYTLISLENPFSRNMYRFSLAWEKPKSWNAHAGYIGEYFPDENNIQTLYVWAVSPAISFSVIELYFGYSFNYANAKESRYVPEKSLKDIIEDFQPDTKITGIYDPYFTPNNQYANSVLANFYIIPSKNITIKLHAAAGFYARAMNPYLYLDKDNNGNIVLKEGFYQESFTPLDLGINLDADLSDKIILKASYTYLQTFFFNSNNFLLSFKIYF